MQERCMDSYSTTFNSYLAMLGYHQELTRDSRWVQCPINELKVEADTSPTRTPSAS